MWRSIRFDRMTVTIRYGDTLSRMPQVSPPPTVAFAHPAPNPLLTSPLLLWSAFVVVHLLLGLLNMYGDGYPLGDMSVYKFWVDQAVVSDYWVGIDAPWVYPILAIVPMLIARLSYPIAASIPAFASSTVDIGLYSASWLSLVLVLDLIAFGVLTGWGRRRDRAVAGWWWVLFLLLLGPIAVGRIDSITVAIAVIAIVFVASRPVVATVLLTLAAWIKVWPGAIVVALVVISGRRARIVLAGAATSAAVIATALSFGSGGQVFSFITQQTSRGLQVEAPIATVWMWAAFLDPSTTTIYFDTDILTWQVRGPGVEVASALMTPLLLIAVAAIVLVGLLAVLRGASASALLPALILAMLTAMIAFQKVGSPQFISWLAVPVILGILTHRAGLGAAFRMPAILVLVVAALTQMIYPYLYGFVLGLNPLMLGVLTVRNGMLFVVLGVAIVAMMRSSVRVNSREGDTHARGILSGTERR